MHMRRAAAAACRGCSAFAKPWQWQPPPPPRGMDAGTCSCTAREHANHCSSSPPPPPHTHNLPYPPPPLTNVQLQQCHTRDFERQCLGEVQGAEGRWPWRPCRRAVNQRRPWGLSAAAHRQRLAGWAGPLSCRAVRVLWRQARTPPAERPVALQEVGGDAGEVALQVETPLALRHRHIRLPCCRAHREDWDGGRQRRGGRRRWRQRRGGRRARRARRGGRRPRG